MNEAIDSGRDSDRLVSASDIAEVANVGPSAVSNWRKRFPDFPAAVGTAPSGGDLFLLADVERWLQEHKRMPKASSREAMQQLWAVADRLRGRALAGEVTGAVAASAVLLHLIRESAQLPSFHLQAPDEVEDWVRLSIGRLTADQPELQRLFSPLAMVDPQLLHLLLNALAVLESGQLAAAVDYVLERGARYGEFRTPEPIARLLAELADPDRAVFDPAVGSGEFLIQAARVAESPPRLFGQELNESTWRIALARLLLRDLEAQIALGDSLAEDRYADLRADVVMCDPPAGARTADLSYAAGESRWQLLGSLDAPPPRASDFTWLAHVIHHLAQQGRGYVLLTNGSLFRKGVEARFRAELLRQGTIEAIIALPAGSHAASKIASALWIVRPATTTPEAVLLIDATGESALSPRLQSRVIETVRVWRQERQQFKPILGFATSVPVLELLGGDAMLNPSRWLYEPELVDASSLVAAAGDAQSALANAHTALPQRPPRFVLRPAAEPTARLRVSDLIDLGEAKLLRPARIKTDEFADVGVPVWLPRDVHDPWRRDEAPKFIERERVDARSITEPGDIVFTTIGGIRTRVDDEGGHVLGTSLQALRLNPEMFDPHAVAALLTSEPNCRLLTGATIPRVNVLELEIPRLDTATANRLGELARTFQHQLDATYTVAAHAEALRQALVDALATGAATIADITESDDD